MERLPYFVPDISERTATKFLTVEDNIKCCQRSLTLIRAWQFLIFIEFSELLYGGLYVF